MPRRVAVEILGDSRSLERAFRRSGLAARGFRHNLVGAIGGIARTAAFAAGAAAVTGFAAVLHAGTKELTEHQAVEAQTAAAIKSTGGSANVTASQIRGLALRLSDLSGASDEAVAAGENMLLAFPHVRNELGKNNAVFTRATKDIVDFAIRTGRDIPGAALLLGKALENPARRIGSLSRAGIVFTKAQEGAIKALEKSGDLLGAQKIVLAELERRYKGAARAAGTTLTGQLNVLHERFKDLSGQIIGGALPAFTKFIRGLTSVVRKVAEAKGFRAKVAIVWEGVREVAGKLWGLLARAFRDLTENLQARLSVVWHGVSSAARGAERALRKAIASVDWTKVWSGARGIADGLQKRLEAIDWGKIGAAIGDGLALAVKKAIPVAKDLAQRISNAISAIDFVALGKKMGPGLAAALVSAFVTLTDPAFWAKNWDLALAVAATVFRVRIFKLFGRLVAPLARLGGDIVLSIAGGIERLAPRLGQALLSGLLRLPGLASRALQPIERVVRKQFAKLGRITRFVVKVLGLQAAIDAIVGFAKHVASIFAGIGHTIAEEFHKAFRGLKVIALKAAIDIVEPFTHIPGFLGGGPFRRMQAGWRAALANMERSASVSAANIGGALATVVQAASGILTQLGKVQTASQAAAFSGAQAAVKALTSSSPEPDLLGASAATVKAARAKQTAAVALREKNARARAKAAAAADKAAKAASTASDAFQKVLDSLSLNLQRAQVTARFSDDLKALRAIQAAIRTRISEEGKTVDLEQKLFDVRQQLADVMKQQRTAIQFKALGLGPTGDVPIPSVKKLRSQLGRIADALKGTFLDTGKTKGLLQRLRKVLSGELGKLSEEVRAKVDELLKGLRDKLAQGGPGPRTKFRVASTRELIEGLGLNPDQALKLRGRLARLGQGGTMPGVGVGAFGLNVGAPQGVVGRRSLAASGPQNAGIIINGPITIVADNPDAFERKLRRKARGTSAQSRGVHPGTRSGL